MEVVELVAHSPRTLNFVSVDSGANHLSALLSNFDKQDSMKALPVQFHESISAREKAIYTFLAEKERRFGMLRTVDAYTPTNAIRPTRADGTAVSG